MWNDRINTYRYSISKGEMEDSEYYKTVALLLYSIYTKLDGTNVKIKDMDNYEIAQAIGIAMRGETSSFYQRRVLDVLSEVEKKRYEHKKRNNIGQIKIKKNKKKKNKLTFNAFLSV